MGQCQKLCYWIEDEDPDEPYTKQQYVEKYQTLKKQSDPIWRRKTEFDGRLEAIKSLKKHIIDIMRTCRDPSKAHIEKEKLDSVYKKCQEADTWLINLDIKQEKLPKTVDPILTLKMLEQKFRELNQFCNPIINTPPPKIEEEKPEEKAAPAEAPKDPTNT